MPPGVINMLPGDGLDVSAVALSHPDLAGIHFTGSTPTFQHLWRTVGANIAKYRSYPRIVGETGGKDFVVAHPSADPDVLRVALLRGAFEFQGQKCSAASRAYVAALGVEEDEGRLPRRGRVRSRWATSPTSPTSWAPSSTTARSPSTRRRSRAPSAPRSLDVLAGGQVDDSVGCFVRPTVVESADPTDQMFSTEYFGPILAVHVYDDRTSRRSCDQMESLRAVRPDRLDHRPGPQRRSPGPARRLRFAAGNFYVNDKPTGAVVGQQPFGGARASGHQRQGRRTAEPAALDVAALASRRRSTRRPTTATRTWTWADLRRPGQEDAPATRTCGRAPWCPCIGRVRSQPASDG